jgi:hypothetical protein
MIPSKRFQAWERRPASISSRLRAASTWPLRQRPERYHSSRFTKAFAVWMILSLVLGSSVCEAGYRVRKGVEGLTFEIAINRNPPVLGKNEIRIAIKDSEGKAIAGAEVTVNYYMPPMPKMPPMNYTVPAAASGDEYRAVMDLIMTGPWNIIVRANHGGKWVRVGFPIDAR